MRAEAATREVWAISDGAAGNERQAVALARALAMPRAHGPSPGAPGASDAHAMTAARAHDASGAADGRGATDAGGTPRVLRIDARVPWKWFSPRVVAGSRFAFGSGFTRLLRGPFPQAAVGCGRQAALALQLLRQASGGACRTVQILDPRIEPEHFDAIVAPAHDGLQEDNVVTTRGALNAIDDAWLDAARRQWPAFGALPGPRTVLLLGGSTRAVALDEPYWRALAGRLGQWIARDGGSLLVSSSRRSPDWLREAARAEFSAVPGVQWHGEDDGPNPYAGLLAWADRIVVTPDSVNLLSEACATRVPVFALADAPLKGKLDVFLRELVAMNRVRPMEAAPEHWPVVPLRELDRVVAGLRRILRW